LQCLEGLVRSWQTALRCRSGSSLQTFKYRISCPLSSRTRLCFVFVCNISAID
jgi:hypothetical protein